MTTINLHHDDIILVPFPLSAPSPTKRRPAVVVSSDHYNSSTGEVIMAPITSRGRALPRVGDYTLLDWQEEGLHATATIDESVAAVELEMGPQRRSMEQPAFVEMVRGLRDRISSGD